MTTLPDTTQPLSEETMITAMTGIMSGDCAHEDIKRFLSDMADRGATVDEITGAARVMREKAAAIEAPYDAVDCCGTGGDASGTYNISTAVAIVAAACGVPIAKHGNRSASSKSGAADVLEALGINLDAPQDKLEEALRKYNFAFLMAPNHHSAMRHVAHVRKKIGTRTIFNILGPLANPAKTKFQLLGVFDQALVTTLAEVLKNLGTTRAWVVHGADGLDEITTTAQTHIAKLEGGDITETTLNPDSFGLPTANPQNLKGGLPKENAQALQEILKGAQNAYRDIVIANTAAVLCIAGKENSLHNASIKAASVLDNGAALELLEQYKDFTHG